MTIPKERTYSIQRTRDFLRSLLDPKLTPKIPKAIRSQASKCLRHFPMDLDLSVSARKLPEIWSEPERDDE